MKIMTALKYFRMMEEKTGKKGVLHNMAKTGRSTFETTPSIPIKAKKYMSSFGQRYNLTDKEIYLV